MCSIWFASKLVRAARAAYDRHEYILRVWSGDSPDIAYMLSMGLDLNATIAIRKHVLCIGSIIFNADYFAVAYSIDKDE